jgi:glycosyltransferase involved in cell wall biosynthesis
MLFAAKETAKPSVVHIQSLIRRDRPLGWPWQSIFRSNLEFLITERALRRLPYLVANSPVVAEHLRQVAPRAEVVVAPVTVDPDLYPRAPLDGPPTAGIIGTGTWPPTARSMRRLVDRIWPHVRRSVPDARLLIAGRGLRPGLSGAPGVEVLGPVRSASEFLRGLSLLLYPLDRGSGMKVKVLESIAAGVPVVTTREGAEGIRGDDGVVVEEDDERLAAAAVRILHDERERRERGAAARRAFDERYAPRPATEPLVELYRRIASI